MRQKWKANGKLTDLCFLLLISLYEDAPIKLMLYLAFTFSSSFIFDFSCSDY